MLPFTVYNPPRCCTIRREWEYLRKELSPCYKYLKEHQPKTGIVPHTLRKQSTLILLGNAVNPLMCCMNLRLQLQSFL